MTMITTNLVKNILYSAEVAVDVDNLKLAENIADQMLGWYNRETLDCEDPIFLLESIIFIKDAIATARDSKALFNHIIPYSDHCYNCTYYSDGHCDGSDPDECGEQVPDNRPIHCHNCTDDSCSDCILSNVKAAEGMINNYSEAHRVGKPAYYDQVRGEACPGAGAVSRDDTNRHLREQRLGFAPADESWNDSHRVIRCIWPDQKITRPIDKNNEWLKFSPVISALQTYFNRL